MELGAIIDALHKTGLNCSITSCCGTGVTAKLGDAENGHVAEKNCKTSREAAEFLDQAAREHYPESVYALQRDE